MKHTLFGIEVMEWTSMNVEGFVRNVTILYRRYAKVSAESDIQLNTLFCDSFYTESREYVDFAK